MSIDKKLITDPTELGLFLVPAYGFERPWQAEDYRKTAYEGRVLQSPWDFTSDSGERHYVSVPGYWDSSLSTTVLTESPVMRRGHTGPSQKWETMCSREQREGHNGYAVGLMVEGRRQFYRHVHQRAHMSDAWRRLVTGPRDCYAAWSRSDGSELPTAFETQDEKGRFKRIYAGRSGRGVIYAATTTYKTDGSVEGLEMRMVCIEFAILDKDPNKDAMMRVTWKVQQRRFADPNVRTPDLPDLRHYDDLDEAWRGLIEHAYKGFLHTCKTVDEEVERERAFQQRQKELMTADKRLDWGEQFEQRIEKADWEMALNACREPWQLEVVISKFSGDHRFWDSPQYDGARYTKVGNMLKMHHCSEERRAELWSWVNGYVAPRDQLWNYVGD